MAPGFVRRCICGVKHTLTLENSEVSCQCGEKLSLKGQGPARPPIDTEETPITISPRMY